MENYFIHDGIAPCGPYTIEELKKQNIHSTQPIWSPELKTWIEAGRVLALQSVIKSERQRRIISKPYIILAFALMIVLSGLYAWWYILKNY
jgi:GYF domain 2